MENLIGKSLGPYQITERLGQSATGALYKAYQPWLKRHVIIRMLPPHLARDPGFMRRMQAAARLAHRNIAAIYDLRQDHGTTYLVTEYIQGTSLNKVVQLDKGLDPRAAASILGELAQALDHAHDQGLVHGGLKPGNILLTQDRRPIVTDFGLTAEQGSDSTDLEALKYMAPEQAQGSSADSRTDVYSLGAALYYMLTGKAPIEGTNPQVIRTGLAGWYPTPPSHLSPAIPAVVDSVVLKALHKDPTRRYQRAGDLAEAFRAAVHRPSKEKEPLWLDTLRRAAVAASLVVLFVVLGVTAFWVWNNVSSAFTRTQGAPTATVPAGPATGETSTPAMTVTGTPVSVESPSGTPTSAHTPPITRTSTALLFTGTPRPTITQRPTVQAPTSTPRPTVTVVPTATSRSTPSPTQPPTVGAAIVLLAPADGARSQGMVTFQWRWDQALASGEIFDVRVCKGEGCPPQFGKVNTGESTYVWQPDQGDGTYRWQVVVIRKEGDRIVAEPAFSGVRQFICTGGCGGPPPTGPGPTPTR